MYYILLSIDFAVQCSDITRSEYMVFHEEINLSNAFKVRYDSRRGKRINYVETLSGAFSNEKRSMFSFVEERVYDVAAVGIMRLTRDYTVVEILRSRRRTTTACFSKAAIGPAKLGGSLSTEHEVEIRFFPRGSVS